MTQPGDLRWVPASPRITKRQLGQAPAVDWGPDRPRFTPPCPECRYPLVKSDDECPRCKAGVPWQ